MTCEINANNSRARSQQDLPITDTAEYRHCLFKIGLIDLQYIDLVHRINDTNKYQCFVATSC